MHQSSFRILRWTEDDRPYTRDFQDLFCTLMVALPLTPHRVRLQKKLHTFTTFEALAHLGNLRFTQSNRRPSPEDPNVMVTTKIATTFSMVPSMARYLCNKFLLARFIETVEGKTEFSTADAAWQLTPKGISLLQSFGHRNGVQEKHVFDVLDSPRNTMQLLVLERDPETDQLSTDRATIEVIFRRFAGSETPNIKLGTSHSDDDSLSEQNGAAGIKLYREKRVNGRTCQNVFTGRVAFDWLMDCCSLVDAKEAYDIAALFLSYGFIEFAGDETKQLTNDHFSPSKSTFFVITHKGQLVAKWLPATKPSSSDGGGSRLQQSPRDSNGNRMTTIVTTPSLRLLFRGFLKETHCEENLVFYLEVRDFLGRWGNALKKQKNVEDPSLDIVRETLAAAYDLYNAFLAPGSPCELNIDHNLRNALVTRMTRFELPDTALLTTVKEVIALYNQAQSSVFKLMASDSVPKFLREPRYQRALAELTQD